MDGREVLPRLIEGRELPPRLIEGRDVDGRLGLEMLGRDVLGRLGRETEGREVLGRDVDGRLEPRDPRWASTASKDPERINREATRRR